MKLKQLLLPALVALAAGTAAHASDATFKINNKGDDNYSLQIEDYKNSSGSVVFNPGDGSAPAPLKESWGGVGYGATANVSLSGNLAGAFKVKFVLKNMKSGATAKFEVATGYVSGWSTNVTQKADGVTFSKELLDGKEGATITIK